VNLPAFIRAAMAPLPTFQPIASSTACKGAAELERTVVLGHPALVAWFVVSVDVSLVSLRLLETGVHPFRSGPKALRKNVQSGLTLFADPCTMRPSSSGGCPGTPPLLIITICHLEVVFDDGTMIGVESLAGLSDEGRDELIEGCPVLGRRRVQGGD
jgi:hypothetical protein